MAVRTVSKFKVSSWEIIDWLEKNVGPIMYTNDKDDTIDLDSAIILGDGWHLTQTYTTIVLIFNNESDELMFILRWS